MCVIICCEKDYPDKKVLKEAEQWNENGGGMAWIEKGKVRYRKGIKGKEMLEIIEKRKVQLPFIVHFRIATVGKVCSELCHPFPIEDEAPLKTHGITDAVLFHNGQWSDWRDWLLKTAIRKGIKMPRDIWSDSRGLAFLAYHYGIDVLNTISTNKIAVLTKNGIQKFGERWHDIGKVSCSNDNFDRSNVNIGGGDETLYGVDDDWSETYGGYSICGFEGYYKDGQWHPKDENSDRKNLAKSIDDTVEEEIEKHLADASKEELENDVKTTDQITRNAIRLGLEEQVKKNGNLPIVSKEATTPKKETSQTTTTTLKEYIDKYDNISDELIANEYYSHFHFRKKHEHKANPMSVKNYGTGRGINEYQAGMGMG